LVQWYELRQGGCGQLCLRVEGSKAGAAAVNAVRQGTGPRQKVSGSRSR